MKQSDDKMIHEEKLSEYSIDETNEASDEKQATASSEGDTPVEAPPEESKLNTLPEPEEPKPIESQTDAPEKTPVEPKVRPKAKPYEPEMPPELPRFAVTRQIRAEGRLAALPDSEVAKPNIWDIAGVVLAAALIITSVFLTTLPDWATLTMRIAAVLGAGYEILWDTINDIRRKTVACDGLPVILAVILTFYIGLSLEGAIAVTVLRLALLLRIYAYCRTKSALLASISLPDLSSELAVGDSFMLEAGQPAPADCRISQGAVTVDMCNITGRRTERPLKSGDLVPAGCIINSGKALAEVVRPVADSAAYRISAAIGIGFDKVTRTERTINRGANLLMPGFLACGVILLMVLTLVFKVGVEESLRRAAAIIALGAPCGVLVSLPLTHLALMTESRKRGVVFLNSQALDGISYAKAVVFEKAGTVTSENFELSERLSDKMDSETFLKVAAHAVSASKNPIARAILAAYREPVNKDLVSDFTEYPGWGVSVTVNGIAVLLGTGQFMTRNRIKVPATPVADCQAFMAVGGIFAGVFNFEFTIDHTVRATVAGMFKNGVDRVAMMSGDGRELDGATANAAGISEYYSECTDEDRARNMSELRSRMDERGALVYVCSPSGSLAAAESADINVVLNTSNLNILDGKADILFLGKSAASLPNALIEGKRAKRAAYIYAWFGLCVKLVAAVLAGTGIVPLWFAVLVDGCLSLALIRLSFSLS